MLDLEVHRARPKRATASSIVEVVLYRGRNHGGSLGQRMATALTHSATVVPLQTCFGYLDLEVESYGVEGMGRVMGYAPSIHLWKDCMDRCESEWRPRNFEPHYRPGIDWMRAFPSSYEVSKE